MVFGAILAPEETSREGVKRRVWIPLQNRRSHDVGHDWAVRQTLLTTTIYMMMETMTYIIWLSLCCGIWTSLCCYEHRCVVKTWTGWKRFIRARFSFTFRNDNYTVLLHSPRVASYKHWSFWAGIWEFNIPVLRDLQRFRWKQRSAPSIFSQFCLGIMVYTTIHHCFIHALINLWIFPGYSQAPMDTYTIIYGQ